MNIKNSLFSTKYLSQKLNLNNLLSKEDIENKASVIAKWKKQIDERSIYTKKEEQLQSDFLNDIFGDVLDYVYDRSAEEYNLEKEFKSKTDGTKPDGVLGYITNDNEDIRVVIELKDSYTNLDQKQNRKNDKRTPVEQAFSYVAKSGGNCKWVIVSNFIEIRVYPANDSSIYQSFNVVDLVKPETIKEFWGLLAKNRLFVKQGVSFTDDLLNYKINADESITNEFYSVYKKLRLSLFNHIKKNNAKLIDDIILSKSQKILDRIIFVCFCEDFQLLPYKIFKEILKETENSRFDRRETKLWERVKSLFYSIDKGYPEENINKFNGGLFKEDPILDALIIKDDILTEILSIEKYSFDSDLNVNILGHIFEQSITDLEEIRASLNGNDFDKKKGKRKKDGVFYTPEYITKYMVSEAIGEWLENKRKEIVREAGYEELPTITDDEWIRIRTGKIRRNNQKVNLHLACALRHREILQNIKVLDPACGSGSFLVQVFDYLKEQRKQINEEISTLEGLTPTLFNYDAMILEDNIYGVDLNEESVEITKLALWLKTANKKEPLTALDDNIKCGNSLLSNPQTVGDRAFDWDIEFKDIVDKGGFDIIIGNPPYVNIANLDEKYRNALKQNKIFKNKTDLYAFFIGLAFDIKNKNGIVSMIVPHTWLSTQSFMPLRELLIDSISEIVELNIGVFSDAVVKPVIFIAGNLLNNNLVIKNEKFEERTVINKKYIKEDAELKINLNWSSKKEKLYSKIKNNTIKLGDIIHFSRGIKTSNDDRFLSFSPKDEDYYKVLRGRNIKAYRIDYAGEYIWYRPDLMREKVGCLPHTKETFLVKEKIIMQRISEQLLATYDDAQYFCLDTTNFSSKILDETFNLKFVVSIINSKLINWWFNDVFKNPTISGYELHQIPLKGANKTTQKPFIDKAEKMLLLKKKLQTKQERFLNRLKNNFENIKITGALEKFDELDFQAFLMELKKQKITLSLKKQDEWDEYFCENKLECNKISTQIVTTDKQINEMVYKLYELTKTEIDLIESV